MTLDQLFQWQPQLPPVVIVFLAMDHFTEHYGGYSCNKILSHCNVITTTRH